METGRKKESSNFCSPFRAQVQSSRLILLPIFQEQIRIDNAKKINGIFSTNSEDFKNSQSHSDPLNYLNFCQSTYFDSFNSLPTTIKYS